MYIPNIITVFRLFLVPLIIWLIVSDNLLAAFIVFLVAGVTDMLDGFLARRFGWQTELGAYLDAIADKALLMSVYASLAFFGHLPAWIAIVVVSRDVVIIGAVMLSWLLDRAIEIRPLFISKVNTAVQIALALLVLANRGLEFGWDSFVLPSTWLTGVITGLSALCYIITWLKLMARYDIDQQMKTKSKQTNEAAL